MRKKLILVFTALALLVPACKTIQYVPIETGHTTEVKDSTIVHFIDSVRITEATRYRDFAWIGDTLKLEGNRSRAWAVADTLKGALIGEIEEDAIEEHHSSNVKEVLKEVHDTTKIEIPVPVDVIREVKVIPKFWRVFGVLGIVLSCVLVCLGIFKLKTRGFFKFK